MICLYITFLAYIKENQLEIFPKKLILIKNLIKNSSTTYALASGNDGLSATLCASEAFI